MITARIGLAKTMMSDSTLISSNQTPAAPVRFYSSQEQHPAISDTIILKHMDSSIGREDGMELAFLNERDGSISRV